MKHLLIGTAGHVDHGKTSLIKALTGIDADRLLEEKKRGITIDLGFAHMELPGGLSASVIDVPGHEKFVKNMLAGAGGIDLALLVIASDDGVMPQTREHLGILQFLGTKLGLVVVTKTDLVDSDWLSLVIEDIRGFVTGTFLEDAQVVCVSSHTGEGIDGLKALIGEKIASSPSKNIAAPFRLPVDRVFTMDGFGTVVTGTLVEGSIKPGDMAEIYPRRQQVRLRGVQVHGKDAKAAYAGQRVALNLAGLGKDELARGDTIAAPGSLQTTRMADVKLAVLKGTGREIRTGQRLHFHYGTGSVLCKAVLVGERALKSGEEGYAQLRFLDEVAVKAGDPFVLRFYSPTETVGGGAVLDEMPKKYRQARAEEAARAMQKLEQGDVLAHILHMVEKAGQASIADIQARFGSEFRAGMESLSGELVFVGQKCVMSASFAEKLRERLTSHLKEYHAKYPLAAGIGKHELRSRVMPNARPADFDEVLKIFDGTVSVIDNCVKLAGHEVAYTEEQSEAMRRISEALANGKFSPPALDGIIASFGKKEWLAKQVIGAMLADGQAVLTEPGVAFSKEAVDEAKKAFVNLSTKGGVTLAEFRDALGTSRKFALSMLEYFDRTKFSIKSGDSRKLALALG